MSDKCSVSGTRVSRRNFLYTAAAGGGAMLGMGLVGSPAAASTKIPQKTASYQATPRGKARCDNCSLWQPPSSCKIVAGTISPAGWCVLYKKKS
jgi:anaerobic selenocysteine-containing dehydrogenase